MLSRLLIIRDDDVSYFTSVDQFKIVHRFILGKRIPLNVAVIPKVCDNVVSPEGGFEGFIPTEMCGLGNHFFIYDNEKLTAFLNQKDHIEVVQHGYSHQHGPGAVPEFVINDISEINNKLQDGIDIFIKAFGKLPSFFVPPYDSVSKVALREIRKKYQGISLSRCSHDMLPVQMWPKYLWSKWHHRFLFSWKHFFIVQHQGIDFSDPECLKNPFDDVNTLLENRCEVMVLTLHSWRFFKPEGALNVKMLKRWEDFLQNLLSTEKVSVIKFSEIGKIQ